jgi:hypothetical protein
MENGISGISASLCCDNLEFQSGFDLHSPSIALLDRQVSCLGG